MALPSATTILSDAAEKQVLLALTGPYKRVAGLYSKYEDIPIPSASASSPLHSSPHSRASHRHERSTVGLGGTGRKEGAAVTTSSFHEFKTSMKMNVPPRYAPNERFGVPLTAAQEVGWRVHEAARWAEAAKTAKPELMMTGTRAT